MIDLRCGTMKFPLIPRFIPGCFAGTPSRVTDQTQRVLITSSSLSILSSIHPSVLSFVLQAPLRIIIHTKPTLIGIASTCSIHVYDQTQKFMFVAHRLHSSRAEKHDKRMPYHGINIKYQHRQHHQHTVGCSS